MSDDTDTPGESPLDQAIKSAGGAHEVPDFSAKEPILEQRATEFANDPGGVIVRELPWGKILLYGGAGVAVLGAVGWWVSKKAIAAGEFLAPYAVTYASGGIIPPGAFQQRPGYSDGDLAFQRRARGEPNR